MLAPFFIPQGRSARMSGQYFFSLPNAQAQRRRGLNWILTGLFILIAAPTASARFAIDVAAPFLPITRINLVEIEALTPQQKLENKSLNDGLPANPHLAVPASRFSLAAFGTDGLAGAAAVDCLTAAIYYEAAHEPITGQRAVAQVIINRVRHPAFPDSVCGVVFEGSQRQTGCQFTFTCDGSLARRPSDRLWLQARAVAAAALSGFVEKSVGHATHYHASYVYPYWAPKLTKLNTIGTHIFYQWQGNWSRPAAFSDSYSKAEVNPLTSRTALNGLTLTAAYFAEDPAGGTTLPDVADLNRASSLAKSSSSMTGIADIRGSSSVPANTNLNIAESRLIESTARLREPDARPLMDTKPTGI